MDLDEDNFSERECRWGDDSPVGGEDNRGFLFDGEDYGPGVEHGRPKRKGSLTNLVFVPNDVEQRNRINKKKEPVGSTIISSDGMQLGILGTSVKNKDAHLPEHGGSAGESSGPTSDIGSESVFESALDDSPDTPRFLHSVLRVMTERSSIGDDLRRSNHDLEESSHDQQHQKNPKTVSSSGFRAHSFSNSDTSPQLPSISNYPSRRGRSPFSDHPAHIGQSLSTFTGHLPDTYASVRSPRSRDLTRHNHTAGQQPSRSQSLDDSLMTNHNAADEYNSPRNVLDRLTRSRQNTNNDNNSSWFSGQNFWRPMSDLRLYDADAFSSDSSPNLGHHGGNPWKAMEDLRQVGGGGERQDSRMSNSSKNLLQLPNHKRQRGLPPPKPQRQKHRRGSGGSSPSGSSSSGGTIIPPPPMYGEDSPQDSPQDSPKDSPSYVHDSDYHSYAGYESFDEIKGSLV